MNFSLNILDELESEAVYIFREVESTCKNPVLLFSGGKDSTVMLHLAFKAFYPHPLPFPIMHVDTGHNFQETLDFRDDLVKKHNLQLIIASVEKSIREGRVQEEGPFASRNKLQSVTLMDAIKEYGFDACFGGGRRDEEKARAKERFFSYRNESGQWDPQNQRPELWSLFNTKKNNGHFRIFPLSNWTELDIWKYVKRENLNLPSLYFAHERDIFERDGVLYYNSPYRPPLKEEKVVNKMVRFRTIGDITCTGAIESYAKTVDDVIQEIVNSSVTERGLRADDKKTETAMEDRKLEGYF